jgi:translation initiation factor 3 subunit E
MAQPNYDLTRTLAPYFDRHLVFPLLEFIDTKKVEYHDFPEISKDLYSEEELLQSKLQLLEKTNMVDFAADIYKKLHKTDDFPQGKLKL